MIKVVEKNMGKKIAYSVDKNKLTFDDDLTINLAKRETDDPVHIDVCYDGDGNLVLGAAAGRRYVAEIDILARKYTEKPNPNKGKSTTADDGMMREPDTIREAVPFSTDRVTLTLWEV